VAASRTKGLVGVAIRDLLGFLHFLGSCEPGHSFQNTMASASSESTNDSKYDTENNERQSTRNAQDNGNHDCEDEEADNSATTRTRGAQDLVQTNWIERNEKNRSRVRSREYHPKQDDPDADCQTL